MANDTKKTGAAAAAPMTVENFTFERAQGAKVATEMGIFSSRHSVTKDKKNVPLDCWLLGDHFMVTEIDRERAREEAEKTGEDVEEAAKNAKPGRYLRCELAKPTIVVQNGNTKVQTEGEVLTFLNKQIERLADYALDKEFVHRWEIFPVGETKVAGNKRSMHNYELTWIEKITREEYMKRKGEAFAAAVAKNTKNVLPANGKVPAAEKATESAEA
jgi:hypothetical protein